MLHVCETMKMNKIDLQNTCMHTGFRGSHFDSRIIHTTFEFSAIPDPFKTFDSRPCNSLPSIYFMATCLLAILARGSSEM